MPEITESELIAQLRAEVADANRCAAQALKDRDLLRDQYYEQERNARNLTASNPLVQNAMKLAEIANRALADERRAWKLERDTLRLEIRLLKRKKKLTESLSA